MALTIDQVAELASAAGFRGSAVSIAAAVAMAESGGRPDACGDSNLTEPGEKSVGLWQINYRPSRDARIVADARAKGQIAARDPDANLDPAINARNAFAISGQGKTFGPWTTYNTGAYRQFLGAAQTSAKRPIPGAGGPAVDLPNLPKITIPGTDIGVDLPNLPKIDLGAPLKTAGDFFAAISAPLRWLINPDNWKRIGIVVVGVALVVLGAVLLLKDLAPAALAAGALGGK